MEAQMVKEILEDINAKEIQVHTRNVQCCCFMSYYRKAHSFGEDNRPSMGVSIDETGTSLVHCFSCGYSSPLVNALVDLQERSEQDLAVVINKAKAFERLDPEALIRSVELKAEKKYIEKFVEESELLAFSPGSHRQMVDRGLTIDTMKAWDFRWDSVFKRVVFPVRTFDNRLVGAVGRATRPTKIKYFNYFYFDKSQYLFGEHMCNSRDSVIIVEGQIDAIMVWQYLHENKIPIDVVSLGGSKASRQQLIKLVRNWSTLLLFLDDDFAGWEGQKILAKNTCRKVLTKVISYPKGPHEDPAELVKSGFNLAAKIESASLAFV